MRFSVICAVFLFFLLLLSGCSSEIQSSSPTPPLSTPLPTSAPPVALTVTDTPSDTPVPPADPIIGSWLCYNTRFGERLEKVYTFQDNNTWTRIDRDLKDRTKANSHGTWKNGGNNQYLMRFPLSGNSGTFRYDTVKDELNNPDYEETYHRTADPGNSPQQVPVINLTLNSEQKVSRLEHSRPFSDKVFLIVNVTLRNIHENESYALDEIGTQVRSDNSVGSYSITVKTGEALENPLTFGTIAPGETRQGNILFTVPENSHSYTLRLADRYGNDASNVIIFENSTAV